MPSKHLDKPPSPVELVQKVLVAPAVVSHLNSLLLQGHMNLAEEEVVVKMEAKMEVETEDSATLMESVTRSLHSKP